MCCPDCYGSFKYIDNYLICLGCQKKYPIKDGSIFFIDDSQQHNYSKTDDSLISKIKEYFKRYNKLYNLLVPIAGALFVGEKRGKDILTNLPPEALIINLGSGPKIISDKIVNIDYFHYKGVLMVADATRLPFKDFSVDGVISESVLEHVKQPWIVTKEIERILKKGGWLYASVPFVDPYHSSPDDYYRWTSSGLRQMLSGFNEKEMKIGWGPTSCLISVLAHWLGIVFSFGNKIIYQIITLFFLCLFSPLKLLDFIFKFYKFSTNLSVGLYFLGTKK